MRLYLSGPMTGMPELNFPAFHADATWLRGHGYEVINPAELNPDQSKTWGECMRTDIKALCDCDCLALMDGWEGSQGAHLEVHIAHRIGIRILHINQLRADFAANLKRHSAARAA